MQQPAVPETHSKSYGTGDSMINILQEGQEEIEEPKGVVQGGLCTTGQEPVAGGQLRGDVQGGEHLPRVRAEMAEVQAAIDGLVAIERPEPWYHRRWRGLLLREEALAPFLSAGSALPNQGA